MIEQEGSRARLECDMLIFIQGPNIFVQLFNKEYEIVQISFPQNFPPPQK